MKLLSLCHLRLKGFFSKGVLFLVLICGIGLFASSLLGGVVIGETEKVVKDLGLRIISLFGVVLCVSIGAGELRQEIHGKTICSLLSKPISRIEAVAGKAMGCFSVVSLLVAFLGLLLWLLLIFMGAGGGLALLKALILIMGEVFLVAAIMTFFSSFSTPYLSGFFTISVYVTGRLLGDLYIFGQKFGGPAAQKVTFLLYRVLPSFRDFQIAGRMAHGSAMSWGEVGLVLSYGISYSMVLLMLAGWIFQKRDL